MSFGSYLEKSDREISVAHSNFIYSAWQKIHLKMLSGKWRPFCLGLNVSRCCNRQGWLTESNTYTSCAGNSPVTGGFPTQRPVTRSFDIFFDLRLNKRLSKQCWGWWFETLSRPLKLHCNDHQTFVLLLWTNDAIIGIIELVKIGSGNGFLFDDTKPLPEPMLTNHQWGSMTFIWEKNLKKYPSHQSLDLAWN